MLVLTRYTHQSIMIGDDVEVHVLSVSGNQVKIGIAAPRDVAVHREEIYQKIKQQQAAALDDGAVAGGAL